jgi:hypothetical protein
MGICFAALAITSHPNGNPLGQLGGGHLQVQGPVSALAFDKLTEEQLRHRPDSSLWTVMARSNIFLDDSASEEAAENKQCFFLGHSIALYTR